MVDATSPGEAYPILARGPVTQLVVPAAYHGLAATIPASGNISSNLLAADGFPAMAIGVTSSQAGQLSVQRYLDSAGTIAAGAALTAALTAATPAVLNNNDGTIFRSFKIAITNTNGSTAANVTGLIVVQQAQ
jgi:hypothetical protein